MFSQMSVCPRGGGACMAGEARVAEGGMRGRGRAWQGGACVAGGGGHAWYAHPPADTTRYGQ